MALLLWALLPITVFLLIIFWLYKLVIFYRFGRTTTSLWYYIDRLAIRPRERKDILALVNMYFLLYLGRPTSNGARPFTSEFWQAYILLLTSLEDAFQSLARFLWFEIKLRYSHGMVSHGIVSLAKSLVLPRFLQSCYTDLLAALLPMHFCGIWPCSR